MENTQTAPKTPKLKLDFKDSKYATGRRKTSIAKVWLKKGTGKIYVNGKLFRPDWARVCTNRPCENWPNSSLKASVLAIACLCMSLVAVTPMNLCPLDDRWVDTTIQT